MPQPTVFITYSQADEIEKKALLSHLGVLEQAGLIELWSDDRIGAGADKDEEINLAIDKAKVAVLLISANFLTSTVLKKEIPKLLDRRRNKDLVVFPVIAKACAWKQVDWLAEMSVRPRSGDPIWAEGGRNADVNLATIATELAKIVREITDDSQSESDGLASPGFQTTSVATYQEPQITTGNHPSSELAADFVIITALEEEREAVLDKLPEYEQLVPSEDDVRVYFASNLPAVFQDGSRGQYRLIVMPLLGMGRIQATVATVDAIRRWRPRYVILVGIAGGVGSKGVNLGDILVSDQIVDYELQKLTPEGPQVRWEVHRADPRLVGAARNFRSKRWQALITTTRPPGGVSRRHIGPIASGDKVIAFGEIMTRYQDTWPALIGVEMEASGVATASFQAANPPGFFMVRSVSDLADENKNTARVRNWRAYACDAAASYTIALLQSGPVLPADGRQIAPRLQVSRPKEENQSNFDSISTRITNIPKKALDAYNLAQNASSDSRYDTGIIRRILTEALSDEDLTICCYDNFPEVYRQFTFNMTFQFKVHLLIEYCAGRDLFDQLLSLVKDINPNRFAQFSSQIGESFNQTQVLEPADLDIELPYGTMPSDSKFYIERTADEDCRKHFIKDRAVTLYVQAPRQMGKSSLLRRIIDRVGKDHNKRFVFLDFQIFPEEYFGDEEKFLHEFCLMLGDALEIPEAIDKYWRGPRTNIIKCSRYLSQYIIPQVGQPLVLAIDEAERLLTGSFSTNFFSMLRVWHNERVSNESFAKLSLFLSSSTEPYLLIDNPHQSPFNVAERINLQDFTEVEVSELNRRHDNLLNPNQVGDLMQEIGGHPYLTRRAFYLVAAGKTDLETLLAQATSDRGPFEDHLHHYLLKILQMPGLRQAVIDISRNQVYEENRVFHRLKGAGLIKKAGQKVVFRNNLYARYFAEHLDG